MKQNDPNKRRVRNDVILIAALLLIALLGGAYLFLFRPQGDTVTVSIHGEVYGVYSLSQDRTEEILTGTDGQLNVLVIRDGKAYVQTATCPDGICAAHRPIYRNGESIVCLPHGVVITVNASDSDDAPDIEA